MREANTMTEAEARAALRAFDGIGGLERWIARQRRWEAVPGGWTVAGELQGWRFRLAPVAGGVRVSGFMGKREPATWVVPGRHCNPAMYDFIQKSSSRGVG